MDLKQEIAERRVAFWWKYGDGTVGVVVRDMTAGKRGKRLVAKIFNTRTELEAELSDQQRKCEEAGLKWDEKRLNLHSGIKYFVKHDAPKRNKERGVFGWQELEEFLQACGTAPENRWEVLRLFSGILSGY